MGAENKHQEEVLKALSTVMDPDLDRNIVELGFIKDMTIADGAVSSRLKEICRLRVAQLNDCAV